MGIVLFEEHALTLTVWESLLFHVEVKLHPSLEDFTLQAGSVEVLIHWNITRVHSLADCCVFETSECLGLLSSLGALGRPSNGYSVMGNKPSCREVLCGKVGSPAPCQEQSLHFSAVDSHL